MSDYYGFTDSSGEVYIYCDHVDGGKMVQVLQGPDAKEFLENREHWEAIPDEYEHGSEITGWLTESELAEKLQG